MKTYEVTITFRVKADDGEMYPGAQSIRKALYEAVEMPGYMTPGLEITATNATVRSV